MGLALYLKDSEQPFIPNETLMRHAEPVPLGGRAGMPR